MLCTQQSFCVKMERGHRHLHSNPYSHLGNTIDLLNPSYEQGMPPSGNPTSFNLSRLSGHHENCASQMDQYIRHHRPQQQLQLPISNNDLDSGGWSNFENSCMSSSSSSHFSIPVTGPDQPTSSSTRGISGNHHRTDDPRGPHKDKNVATVPGEYANDVSSLNFSLSSSMQNWDKPCEVGFNNVDIMNFSAPEYRCRFLPLMEGPQPDIVHLQMDSPFWNHYNHNCLVQGNYFSPMFQPGFTWVEHLGSNVGVCSSLNNHAIPYSEGPFNIGNMGIHHGSSFGRTAVIFPPSWHNQYHLQPVQGMQIPNYSHHPRIPVPSYGLSVNNLVRHGIINTSREGIDSVARVPGSFPSSSDEWSYRPHRRPSQAVTDSIGNQVRIFSAQENSVLGFPGFQGADNFFDRHRDMRLDIDNMSYEELLALEEQIGDVKTGLPEEAILNNLKTRIFFTPASSLNPSFDTAPENGNCIICQVEYVEKERMGTLQCGHEYHADCIRQWLLVKNICPICKTAGLDIDKR